MYGFSIVISKESLIIIKEYKCVQTPCWTPLVPLIAQLTQAAVGIYLVLCSIKSYQLYLRPPEGVCEAYFHQTLDSTLYTIPTFP